MVIETRSIPISEEKSSDGREPSRELLDALETFSKSRSTRLLLRQAERNNVRCDLRVPLLKNCRVKPQELARALRQLFRTVIDAAGPDERFTVDFHIDLESRLVMQAARTDDPIN